MSDIEIEIQAKIEHKKPLLDFLKKQGKFVGEQHQIDEYYTAPHRDFIAVRPAKEWLRLRDDNGKYSINYKNWYFTKTGESHYCDEYESPVANIEKLQKIFEALDFKKIATVDKKRQLWMYDNYEFAIDSVANLGDFVEIEYKGSAKVVPTKVTAEMIKLLKKIGCGRIERNYNGYPFMLLFPDEVKIDVL